MKKIFQTIFLFLFFPLSILSQVGVETVLSLKVLRSVIDKTSGAMQLNNLFDIGAYEHDRKASEFEDLWRETKFVFEKAKEYGLSEVKIEKWKSESKGWDGESGELWMIEPEKRLIISFRDEVMALAPNSSSGEWQGEMIYIGNGTNSEIYKNVDVKGKIVLSDVGLSGLYQNAVVRNKALGVVSFNAHHNFDNPDKISSQSLPVISAEQSPSFGFNISPRIGKELVDLYNQFSGSRSQRGKIVLKAIVKSQYRDYSNQLVTAVIPGDGTSKEEICLSAHLFEGIQKQGANDDLSGCITLLEVGRSLNELINEGQISKPSRTIRFLWVPEISGSYWFLTNHTDIADNTKLNINLDMVGEDTHKNLNTIVLYLNLHSRAHWSDDAAADLMEWVNKNNGERLETRGLSYGYQIFDIIGTRHPFYYSVEPWSAGSDHQIFQMQQFRIPSVFFNNWPDVNYHTSFDRPTFSDATELKRIGVIASSLSILGSATKEVDFYKVANVVYGNVLKRLGECSSKEINAIQSIADSNLTVRFRDANYIMQGHFDREIDRLKSLSMFSIIPNKALEVKNYIEMLKGNLLKLEKGYLNNLSDAYKFTCSNRKVKETAPEISKVEKEMASMIPQDIIPTKTETRERGSFRRSPIDTIRIPGLSQRYYSELKNFVDGEKTILQIRNLVSAEFEPITLEGTLRYFKELEKQNYLKLNKK